MKNSDKDPRKHGRKEEDARVDESSDESFPASDPPSWTSGVSRRPESGSAAPARHQYLVRQELRPKDLPGISEDQLGQHWKLYEGYVKNVNLLNEKLAALASKKDFGPEFAELKRRLGFEYDGMILHEHYFGILRSGRKPLGDESSSMKLMKKSFGSFDAWKEEFTAIGKMRGVGWAILYFDPRAGTLTNHWIGMHEEGHPAGFVPILVMDVWEHAFMVDAGADGRPKYIEAFFKNVDWPKVEQTLAEAMRSSAGLAAQEM
jgi:superoxide dismutase, Fe-Mn family